MRIETRHEVLQHKGSDGLVKGACFLPPLVKMSANVGSLDDPKAVCLNGQWFVPATPKRIEELNIEWERIK